VIAIDRDPLNASFWIYPGIFLVGGRPDLGPRFSFGSHWENMDLVFSPGDFDGDGHPDVIARTKLGINGSDLLLYRGTGAPLVPGAAVFSGPTRIGTGWQGFTRVFSPGDLNGDGHPDVLGLTSSSATSSGALLLYMGDGKGGWSYTGIPIGSGVKWGSMLLNS
jgi:hypothetical protein